MICLKRPIRAAREEGRKTGTRSMGVAGTFERESKFSVKSLPRCKPIDCSPSSKTGRSLIVGDNRAIRRYLNPSFALPLASPHRYVPEFNTGIRTVFSTIMRYRVACAITHRVAFEYSIPRCKFAMWKSVTWKVDEQVQVQKAPGIQNAKIPDARKFKSEPSSSTDF